MIDAQRMAPRRDVDLSAPRVGVVEVKNASSARTIGTMALRSTLSLGLFALLLATTTACGGSHKSARVPGLDGHDDTTAETSASGDVFEGREGFTVRLPKGFPTPTRKTEKDENVRLTTYTSSVGRGTCLVTLGDFEQELEGQHREALDAFQKGMLGEDGRLEDAANFKYRGAPARTYVFVKQTESGRVFIRVVALVVGSRMYALAFFSANEGARWREDVDGFLTSLDFSRED
jgi:hypothetical protein